MQRYFNLSYRQTKRPRPAPQQPQASSQAEHSNRIQRGVPKHDEDESFIGSFLIRVIICITIFSAVMLMKNSNDSTVNYVFDALCAWSQCNYSIPEEYSVEKFVDALVNGGSASVFGDEEDYLKFPTEGNVVLGYGQRDQNGAQCFGILISSPTPELVMSSHSGSVTEVGNNNVLGNYVTVESPRIKVIYGCCDGIIVSNGDAVDTSTAIASLSQGKDGEYYLYMEVHVDGNVLDPQKCFENGVSA
ncbi:MAG: M23 family metallopeptidase [Clostridiales bacterium]|nr:M23 family metallopeptidase [Clostridiales bacterium]